MIESNANLGMHGQGLLKLSGPGDSLRAQRLFVSLFYTVHVSYVYETIVELLKSPCFFKRKLTNCRMSLKFVTTSAEFEIIELV